MPEKTRGVKAMILILVGEPKLPRPAAYGAIGPKTASVCWLFAAFNGAGEITEALNASEV